MTTATAFGPWNERTATPNAGYVPTIESEIRSCQAVAEGVTVDVRRNEVWLVAGKADAAVGPDDLMDAVGSAA
jgi:hypothetical protein